MSRKTTLIGLTLAILAAAPAAAQAENAGLGSGPCLQAQPPTIQRVSPDAVHYGYRFSDSCVFPARTSIEIRPAGGAWREVHGQYTPPTHGDWTARAQSIGDLQRDTRYELRSRIEYLGRDATTSSVFFDTGGEMAHDIHTFAHRRGGALEIGVSAIVSPIEKYDVELRIAETDREGSDRTLPLPYAHCEPGPGSGERCTWQIDLRVLPQGGVAHLPGKNWIVDGLRYRAVPTLTRSVYDRSFGDTPAPPLEFTVGQGPASITSKSA
jgi:hypothetical protein